MRNLGLNILGFAALTAVLLLPPRPGSSQPLPFSSAPNQRYVNLQNEALVNYVMDDGSIIPEIAIAIPSALSEVKSKVISAGSEAETLVQEGDTFVLKAADSIIVPTPT